MRRRHGYTIRFAVVAVVVLVSLVLFATLIPAEGEDGTLWPLTVLVYAALALALVSVVAAIVRAARRFASRGAKRD